ncbi:MAG: uracil-DNA glycosylase [Mycobacteriales bacterium]
MTGPGGGSESRRPAAAGAAGGWPPAAVRGVGVAPGSGWPGDPATARTPVAGAADDVRRLAASATGMPELDALVSVCRACPRLVAWREEVAVTRRAAFADQTYWGRPAPGFGPADARMAVLGRAPAAHGANRTGRVFTGDRSGDWLYAALHRAGLANQPTSVHAGDGLQLYATRIVASVRCAPPANKPTPDERDTCRPWLVRELALLAGTLRVVVVLGAFGWQALWPALTPAGLGAPPARRPVFGHGAQVTLPGGLAVLGSYHVSQQNTFTGKLTEPMLDAIFVRARELAGLP